MDWKERKARILENARRVVVKVGSAVLTTESGLDPRVFSRLVDQLSSLHDQGMDVVLVSSGAVACGRARVGRSELCELPDRQAASAIGQSRLMHEYDEMFRRYGKITAQILLTRDDFRQRERFLNARNTVSRLLEWRVIPVVNENDTVSVKELEFGDNDTLASFMLNLVEADLFVNVTSADGVYDRNPDGGREARRLDCIENIGELDIEAMCGAKTSVGKGGMQSKLLAARRAAQLGVPTLILSGARPFALERAFKGEDCGTIVMPDDKAISRKKFWLAYHDTPSGDLVVDEGAARALESNGKSLLAAGITEVRGAFEAGALVRIITGRGQTVGVGMTRYSAVDLDKIRGKRTSDIPDILGSCPYPEAVHRDDLLIDPAI